jgi:LmbE family N-acetylglucosaminyl deacetylase
MTAAETLARLGALPAANLHAITRGGPPVILSPHPDDESLGCGGLIAACASRGIPPVIVWITDGTQSHPSSHRFKPAIRRHIREAEARRAAAALGVPRSRLHFLRFPDQATPSQGPKFAAAVRHITNLITAHGCRVVLAPWSRDPHPDHSVTHQIATRLALPQWSYLIWGWTLPTDVILPDHGLRLNISCFLPAKRRAIAAHRSQHGYVFTDAAEGCILSPEFLAFFDRPWEVFLAERPLRCRSYRRPA